MSYDLVLRGGTVVSPTGRYPADIAMTAGRVAAVGQGLGPAAEVRDITGLVVIPGLVDGHVHFREPGMTHKEDFSTGSRAAAAGGVTTVLDMPNTVPPVATLDDFKAKRETVAPKAHVDFGLFGVLSESSVEHIGALAEAGACGLKLFMGETTGNNPCPPDAAILAGMRQAAAHQLVVGAHAENDSLLQYLKAELQAAGRTDARAHLESRPDFVEQEAVDRFLTLAAATGVRAHVHHLSSARGLEALRVGRARGARATAEALVAHLVLDDTAYERYGPLVKLNPPIRPAADRLALRRAVAVGEVDTIGSDHAPHEVPAKTVADVWEAAAGFIGVETMLPLLLTQVAEGHLSLETVVARCCRGPAQLWGLRAKGWLGPGSDADLVLVDTEARWRIEAARLQSRHKVTPYEGWTMTGRVVSTYLGGKLVYCDGEVVGPAAGRMVRPEHDAHFHAGVAATGATPTPGMPR